MKKRGFRLFSAFLGLCIALTSLGISCFAEGGFTYYFADDGRTTAAIAGFTGTADADGVITVPADVDGYPVVLIASRAFADRSDLKTLIVGADVEIADDAFVGCTNTVTVVFEGVQPSPDEQAEPFSPGGEEFAMSGKKLVKYNGNSSYVAVPDGCETIGASAFAGNTTVSSVDLPSSLKKIEGGAFSGCSNLASVDVDGDGAIEVGAGAFDGTPFLTSVVSPFVMLGTTLISCRSSDAFVTVPTDVEAIADGAFSSSSAKSVKLFKAVEIMNAAALKKADGSYPAVYVDAGSFAQAVCASNGIEYKISLPYGDADGNGKTTAYDARFILRVSAKLENPNMTEEQFERCDIDRDKTLTSKDARRILRISAKLDTFEGDVSVEPVTAEDAMTVINKIFTSAKVYAPSYSKYAYQEWESVDIRNDLAIYYNRFDNDLTSKRRAQTVSFAPHSKEAAENLPAVSLLDPSRFASYTMNVSDDGVYDIRIVLKDETVTNEKPDADVYTPKLLPAERLTRYTDEIADTLWGRSRRTNLNISMTYTGCTLEIKAHADTLNLVSVSMNVYYKFNITGTVNGTTVKTKIFGGEEYGSAVRHDVVELTGFAYNNA